MKPIYARAGDVFFTRSNSILGRLIRWAETDPGEEPTWANHTGVVVEDGWIVPPPWAFEPGADLIHEYTRLAVVVEALWHVRRGTLNPNNVDVRVFRPVPAYSAAELVRFRREAGRYVGDKYGWWKLLFHLADRAIFKGRKVLSQTLHVDERPICSYLAAKVHEVARPGEWFGVRPEVATPDEMLDFVQNSERWQEVR